MAYEVLTRSYPDHWENVWADAETGEPSRFPTFLDAARALNDHLTDCENEGMDTIADDFRIVEAPATGRYEYDCEQPDAQPWRGPNDTTPEAP